MRVISFVALLLLTPALAGCLGRGSSAASTERADKTAIKEVIRSAWNAELAGDENTACLYYTPRLHRRAEPRVGGTGLRGRPAPGRLRNGPERVPPVPEDHQRARWIRQRQDAVRVTRVSHDRHGDRAPILPDGMRCLNPVDCQVVISLVIHLVDEKNGRWLIDDLDASACEVHGSCVPLDNKQVM